MLETSNKRLQNDRKRKAPLRRLSRSVRWKLPVGCGSLGENGDPMSFERTAFIGSALWSVAASAYLLLSPLTIQEVRGTGSADGSYVAEEITRQASWYQVQGLWGVLLLAIFASLFILIAFLAMKRRFVALLVISLLATVLVLLAGFSIGIFYLPAVIAVSLGWTRLDIHRILRASRPASA